MAKKDRLDRRSGYYQTIAKYFIDLRGAPFFLSSKELDLIRQWEEKGIPLRVVLEGIQRSFEPLRYSRKRRRKPYTLDFCHSSILRAFDLYRDRRVGQKVAKSHAKDKRRERKILLEVERFLAVIPEEHHNLKPIYLKLHRRLSLGKATEEELEEAEEAIEGLIEENLSPGQVKRIITEIRSEFGMIGGTELEQIFRIKALKAEREKHKIPHVSPFYY